MKKFTVTLLAGSLLFASCSQVNQSAVSASQQLAVTSGWKASAAPMIEGGATITPIQNGALQGVQVTEGKQSFIVYSQSDLVYIQNLRDGKLTKLTKEEYSEALANEKMGEQILPAVVIWGVLRQAAIKIIKNQIKKYSREAGCHYVADRSHNVWPLSAFNQDMRRHIVCTLWKAALW